MTSVYLTALLSKILSFIPVTSSNSVVCSQNTKSVHLQSGNDKFPGNTSISSENTFDFILTNSADQHFVNIMCGIDLLLTSGTRSIFSQRTFNYHMQSNFEVFLPRVEAQLDSDVLLTELNG